jgi:hypothetical protein
LSYEEDLAAIKEDGYALRFVKEQTPGIIRASLTWFDNNQRGIPLWLKEMIQWELLILE